MDSFNRRKNMVNASREHWRPPLFRPPTTPGARLAGAARRFLDFQAGTIYHDVQIALAGASGCLLDVGCGAQPLRPLVPPSMHYTGIDTVDAGEHFGYNVPDTLYFEGTTWPVDDASVDVILCTETLEHVLHPMDLLAEAARVLRPGGKMIVTVPFSARWHFIPHDYWRYTPSSLADLLNAAGFTDIAVYARGNEVTVACYKVMALILPLLLGQGSPAFVRIFEMLLGLVLLPILLLLAVIGNLSLLGSGGNDCLGYTATAVRR
ncbi:MAG: class I SAM-dependent methyltransferase [Capsulimonadaceae bacterium]